MLLDEILDQIEANQDEFDRLASSWHGWTPWGLFRLHRLIRANEPLFARLGIPPDAPKGGEPE